MSVLRKQSEVLENNKYRQKPPVPGLPETAEALNDLLVKPLKVLYESMPIDERGGEYHPGGVAVTDLELECPFCGMKFKGVRRSGCFMHYIFPHTCPNCNFPNNIFEALYALRKSKN